MCCIRSKAREGRSRGTKTREQHLANFRQETSQGVKSLTSTQFNCSRKRRHFLHQLHRKPVCSIYTCNWIEEGLEGNTAPSPIKHTNMEAAILAGRPGLGRMPKEGFGLSCSHFHLSQGKWTQVQAAKLKIPLRKYFLGSSDGHFRSKPAIYPASCWLLWKIQKVVVPTNDHTGQRAEPLR